jgi:hypothetical protein
MGQGRSCVESPPTPRRSSGALAGKLGDVDLDACGVFVLVVVAVIVAVAALASSAAAKRRNQLAAAWGAYQQALQRLRSNPGSSELRVQALAWGRSHYSLARKDGVPTIYDEMALANDLTASAAPGTHAPSS